MRWLWAHMRSEFESEKSRRAGPAQYCASCGGPVDGCPPAWGPCPDEAHSSLRTACLPRLRRAPLSLSAAPYLPPIFSHTLRLSFNQMPLLRLPAAGGKAKAVSVDHKLAAGVAIALVFLILMAHTVYSGPQGCKLFCPDNNIHDPAPECNFSKPTGIFKSEYACRRPPRASWSTPASPFLRSLLLLPSHSAHDPGHQP